jgi:hypothetical protein
LIPSYTLIDEPITKSAQGIENRLNELKTLMRDGTHDLSEKNRQRLKAWLN